MISSNIRNTTWKELGLDEWQDDYNHLYFYVHYNTYITSKVFHIKGIIYRLLTSQKSNQHWNRISLLTYVLSNKYTKRKTDTQ